MKINKLYYTGISVMNKNRLSIAAGLFTLILLLTQCGNASKRITFEPVQQKVIRFDQALFAVDKYAIKDSVEYFARTFPDFFPLYTNRIIDIGDVSHEGIGERLQVFTNNQTVYLLKKQVEEVFADFLPIEQSVNLGLGAYRYYFPDRPTPQIYTYISGLNQSIITDEGLIGVSVDKYLGADEPLYQLVSPPIAAYLRARMHAQKIPSDVMYALSIMQFPYFDKKDNLLSRMIYEGRAHYFVKQLLPDHPDTLIFGYNPGQLKFCEENEERMWTYLIENKLLFITDGFKIHQYVNDAPFTKDFTQNSPGKALVWVGYRMVEAFMQKQGEVSLSELMEMNDYQAILDQSRYNP